MKKLLTLFLMVSLSFTMFAQDSTSTPTTGDVVGDKVEEVVGVIESLNAKQFAAVIDNLLKTDKASQYTSSVLATIAVVDPEALAEQVDSLKEAGTLPDDKSPEGWVSWLSALFAAIGAALAVLAQWIGKATGIWKPKEE